MFTLIWGKYIPIQLKIIFLKYYSISQIIKFQCFLSILTLISFNTLAIAIFAVTLQFVSMEIAFFD
ncbi:hypothetical protein CKA32_002680 [Geitlerinema sp. FC II]|nr:hypothetical protein CKA32_006427 [Geitlerinema sp. FC II]PPT11212.1 hypothetical protein CKA32_002680 [Geitlerinema sp. FC II]